MSTQPLPSPLVFTAEFRSVTTLARNLVIWFDDWSMYYVTDHRTSRFRLPFDDNRDFKLEIINPEEFTLVQLHGHAVSFGFR